MPKKSKDKSTSGTSLLIGVTAAALALLTALTGINKYNGEKVIEVIDGDTFKTATGQVVRLYSIDAPELGRCMSEQSKNKLSSLILGKRVTLRDIRSGGFNRVMGYTYVNEKSVEVEMMRSGMAVMVRGTKDVEGLMEANTYARTHKLGVFSSECYQLENMIEPKCNIKGNLGETKKDRNYFIPSCPNYTQTVVWTSFGDQWFCSEHDAQVAGFLKGTKCK